MQHECKITVLEKKCFADYQEQYLADPKSGPCPCFNVGDTFLLRRTPRQDDFYHLMNGKFCGEAWDAISRYVYTALQGGSIMHGWTNDDRIMIACCNDGTRPVIFKIERIDIPENDAERMAEPVGQDSDDAADRGGDGDDFLLFHGKRGNLRQTQRIHRHAGDPPAVPGLRAAERSRPG